MEIEGFRNKVEQDYDQREQKHDLNKELLKLKVENGNLQTKIEKLIKKLEQKKVLEQELRGLKDDKSKLEEEVRKTHRETSEQKDLYLRVKEEKIRLESQTINLESRLQSLLKDNEALEKNLNRFQAENSSIKYSSNESFSDLQKSLQILQLEKERDQLKWTQEKQLMENKINEYSQLNQSKEYEFRIKEEQLKQRLQDEVESVRESHRDESDKLQSSFKEAQLSLKFLQDKLDEQDKDHYRTNAYISSQFYNLGMDHIRSQKDGSIKSVSWLEKQRMSAYVLNFEQIYNPY